ncbi:hypothetical protein ACLQ25_24215 [Micromonospora sp. DT44]|uniref:hypothetical protein n=1 Tax=Micromonospora sp. DT44 TaxID=3393439 RepID=UPI003CEDDBA5
MARTNEMLFPWQDEQGRRWPADLIEEHYATYFDDRERVWSARFVPRQEMSVIAEYRQDSAILYSQDARERIADGIQLPSTSDPFPIGQYVNELTTTGAAATSLTLHERRAFSATMTQFVINDSERIFLYDNSGRSAQLDRQFDFSSGRHARVEFGVLYPNGSPPYPWDDVLKRTRPDYSNPNLLYISAEAQEAHQRSAANAPIPPAYQVGNPPAYHQAVAPAYYQAVAPAYYQAVDPAYYQAVAQQAPLENAAVANAARGQSPQYPEQHAPEAPQADERRRSARIQAQQPRGRGRR